MLEVLRQLQEVNERSVITLAKVEELEREKTAQFRNTFELEALVEEKTQNLRGASDTWRASPRIA